MEFLSRMCVRTREASAQTMTEYALITAAIAVACFTAYNLLGTAIRTLLNNIAGGL